MVGHFPGLKMVKFCQVKRLESPGAKENNDMVVCMFQPFHFGALGNHSGNLELSNNQGSAI